MHKCKKFKQVQVQLGYGVSEPKNVSSSNEVHKTTMYSSTNRLLLL